MSKLFCVYILTNKPRGTLYIGVTSNLPQRIAQHRAKLVEGFTGKYGLERLVWFEVHENAESAIHAREAGKKVESPLENRASREDKSGMARPL